MAGYFDTKKLIEDTLVGRPEGTMIYPEDHQNFALSLLDYIHSVELLGASSLQGIATPTTTPVQPDDAYVSYIATVPSGETYTFTNFHDENGDPISVTSAENTVSLLTLLWNGEYWQVQVTAVQLAVGYSDGYLFKGMAVLTPTPTDPGEPDQNVFYLAIEPGTYTNFGNLVVVNGEVAILKWDGSWSKEITGIAKEADVSEIQYAITEFSALTPTEDVSGKFIYTDGSERSNATTGYFKFTAEGGVRYAFSGNFHSTGYNIPYLIAFDAEDNCLGVVGSFIADDGVDYDRQIFIAPAGTAYVTLNYRISYKSSFAVYSTSLIRSDSCLRSLGALPACDFNSLITNGLWLLVGENYVNNPLSGNYGFLRVIRNGAVVLQEAYDYTGARLFKRRFNYTGSNMEDWGEVGQVATMRGVLPSGDLDDVVKCGTFLLADSNTYQHVPNNARVGFFRVSPVVSGTWVLQEFIDFTGGGYYKRKFSQTGADPGAWEQISGGGAINNYYTYEVTATPTITTDTNQFLSSTGDTTDRTFDIITLLQTTGVCRLGPGEFYVDGIIMPDNTQIIGSGPTTKVYLIAGANKFAIKMGKHCAVKNFALIGAASHTPASTVGTRHGILWQGNYSSTEASAQQPNQGVVDTMWISNFAGGGITCTNTGYATDKAIECTNCWITSCDAGINISYWSEFHKFTNIRTASCYYGCVNNGGNNMFVNCDFSSCKEGFLMDNSQSQSPNNSHGSAIGCVFNHSNSNAGVGIRILGCANGFVFIGCQIFYSQTVIENSDGVTFSACNYGETNCNISINGGGAVLFIGNMHQGAPTITITDNTNVHFVNCYVRSTGAVVSN